jgi:hypothetical protein
MNPENHSQGQYDPFAGQLFDGQPPTPWQQSLSPMPSQNSQIHHHSQSQPWDLQPQPQPQQQQSPNHAANFGSIPSNSFAVDPNLVQYSTMLPSDFSYQANMNNSVNHAQNFNMASVAIQPKASPNHFTYQPQSHQYHQQQPAYMAQPAQSSTISPSALSISPSVPTTPVLIDQIPAVPLGQRSTTNPMYTLVDMTSLLQATNSKPLSRYVAMTSRPVELPHSKSMFNYFH